MALSYSSARWKLGHVILETWVSPQTWDTETERERLPQIRGDCNTTCLDFVWFTTTMNLIQVNKYTTLKVEQTFFFLFAFLSNCFNQTNVGLHATECKLFWNSSSGDRNASYLNCCIAGFQRQLVSLRNILWNPRLLGNLTALSTRMLQNL